MKDNYLFAVLPYLKTSKAITIGGITFSDSKNILKFPKVIQHHIKILRKVFFLRGNLRIDRLSIAFFKIDVSQEKVHSIIEPLVDVQNFISYIYSSPHEISLDTFLSKEHADLFIFTPSEVSTFLLWPSDNVKNVGRNKKKIESNESYEVDGYDGLLNNESQLWITDGSRIYPSKPHFYLNISQDLYRDFNQALNHEYNRAFDDILSNKEKINLEVKRRIYTSLKWYNRSNSYEIPDELSLIFLAIAFESLLSLEQGPNITQRFKESVLLLVGPIPKLDSWIEQFYNARSKIVHKGFASNIMFDPRYTKKSSGLKYRSLVSYGRQIFHVSLCGVVSGSKMSTQIGLDLLFKTNHERFKSIIKILREENVSPFESLRSCMNDINEIESFRFVKEEGLEIGLIIGALHQMVVVFLEARPTIDNSLLTLFEELISIKNDSNYFKRLSKIEEIKRVAGYTKLNNKESQQALNILLKFIKLVWDFTFREYFRLERSFK